MCGFGRATLVVRLWSCGFGRAASVVTKNAGSRLSLRTYRTISIGLLKHIYFRVTGVVSAPASARSSSAALAACAAEAVVEVSGFGESRCPALGPASVATKNAGSHPSFKNL